MRSVNLARRDLYRTAVCVAARYHRACSSRAVDGMIDAMQADSSAGDALLATLERQYPAQLRALLDAAAQRFDPVDGEEVAAASKAAAPASAPRQPFGRGMRKQVTNWPSRVLEQASNTASAAKASSDTTAPSGRMANDMAWMSHANWIARAAKTDEDGFASKADADAAAAAAATTPTPRQLTILAVMSAVPMIGFGFVDNLIMIVAGETIEHHFGLSLGITTLAAAGLGNAFSDVAGIFLSGSIEAGSGKLGIPDPGLNKKQAASRSARLVTTGAGAFGIFFGCIIGMCPLLFIEPTTASAAAAAAATAVGGS